MSDGFDLSRTFVHLGLGAKATPLPDFTWTAECLENYDATFAADGSESRLVCVTPQLATWDSWERHPGGEEVVFLISGRVDMILDIEGVEHVIALHPGQAMINPCNVWHTSRVLEPGSALFITPGLGTEHRPLT
jgi:mannose-6-phosphate isomerase-like protein (cupin superfamily)